jgi:hypothetical protein
MVKMQHFLGVVVFMHPCCKNAPLLRKHHKNTPIFTQIDAVSVPKRNDFSGLAWIGTPIGAIRVT